jgi:hypothetical protein
MCHTVSYISSVHYQEVFHCKHSSGICHTVSYISSVHYQEVFHCTHSSGICHTVSYISSVHYQEVFHCKHSSAICHIFLLTAVSKHVAAVLSRRQQYRWTVSEAVNTVKCS